MSNASPITAINGVLHATLSPLDRGLAYGDGLFETCRVLDGQVPLWRWHHERLLHGCRRLGIAVNEAELLAQRDLMLRVASEQSEAQERAQSEAQGSEQSEAQARVQSEPQERAQGVLKVIVTPGAGGRGLKRPEDAEPTLCWVFYPGESPQWESGAREGISALVCEHRLADNPAMAGLKHLNRLDYVLARAEWDNEHQEGLLLDARDNLVEGTISNVFGVLEGQLVTPVLSHNGVAGVMRRLLMEKLAPGAGLAVNEAAVPLSQLTKAEEVFVCNSVFGIWPIVQLAPGGMAYSPGPVTRRLQKDWTQWLNARLMQEGVE